MAVDDALRRARRGLLFLVGVLVSTVTVWTLSRSDSEIDGTRRHFAELQRQVVAGRAGKAARANDRGRVLRLQAQARAASGASRDALEAQASAINATLAWGDGAAVRAAVLASPLIARGRTVAPVVVPDASAHVVAKTGIAGATPIAAAVLVDATGCAACHMTVTVPGYEAYPPPFKTHPNLATYVGAQSRHPASTVACRQCHDGNALATTFVGAGHSTMDAARRARHRPTGLGGPVQ